MSQPSWWGWWEEMAECRVRAKPLSTQGRGLERGLGPKRNQPEELTADTGWARVGRLTTQRATWLGRALWGYTGCLELEASVGNVMPVSRTFSNDTAVATSTPDSPNLVSDTVLQGKEPGLGAWWGWEPRKCSG